MGKDTDKNYRLYNSSSFLMLGAVPNFSQQSLLAMQLTMSVLGVIKACDFFQISSEMDWTEV